MLENLYHHALYNPFLCKQLMHCGYSHHTRTVCKTWSACHLVLCQLQFLRPRRELLYGGGRSKIFFLITVLWSELTYRKKKKRSSFLCVNKAEVTSSLPGGRRTVHSPAWRMGALSCNWPWFHGSFQQRVEVALGLRIIVMEGTKMMEIARGFQFVICACGGSWWYVLHPWTCAERQRWNCG